MTTKFSRRTRIQPTPWPCKRSPPCLPEPPPTDQHSLMSITVIWKQPPFGYWPHPGWYYIDQFNIEGAIVPWMWWQGNGRQTEDGFVRGDLRWNPYQQKYRLGFQFLPKYLLPLKRGTVIAIDLPHPPFCSGPHYTTDDEGIATIVSTLTLPA